MSTDTPNPETPPADPQVPAAAGQPEPEQAATEQAATEQAATEQPTAGEPAAETEVAEGGIAGDLTLGGGVPEAPPVRLPSRLRGRVMADGTVVATGRRKTAVARVRLKKGAGNVVINDRPLEDFFRIERDRLMVAAPLKAVELDGQYDIWVRVAGGGISGQAGAIVLGIARCLQTIQPDLHGALSDNGFLTRDDRMVERKKYGHRKARRSFQFSKR